MAKDFHPFEYISSKLFNGLNLDFLKCYLLILDELTIKSDSWSKLYSDINLGKLDISPAMQRLKKNISDFSSCLPHVVVANMSSIISKLKASCSENGFYESYKKTPGYRDQHPPPLMPLLQLSEKLMLMLEMKESALYYK